ncbi:GNAT family N-acetyltransferase [Halobellus rufus]|uniref:GNAT family N-acetyltransferase n=1 Tax=Halobellus rufus TaxID=1448860 RepID=UPI000678DEF3|nr:GNAT family N-acetyltransferase [Halobellus rufus]
MSSDESYAIRLYEPGDRAAFLELFEEVFGGGSDAWFRWKYLENPYVSHVPMFVAEHDGDLVGARPYMAFRLRVGDETPLGLQTGDTMVHPDHQRRGLFTRMTERSFEYYGGLAEDVLTFSVPNALSRPGYLKLGCREVGQLTAAYRVQNPAALADGIASGAAAALSPLVAAGLGVQRLRRSVPGDVRVTRHDDVPSATLASLYEQAVPDVAHARRDERFYDWRFDRPDWAYETYLARDRGSDEPVAGVVLGRQRQGGTDVVALADVVPLVGGDRRQRGLSALLDRIVDDERDADLLVAPASVIPKSLLYAYGFLLDDRLPLSKVTTPTILISRRFDGREEPSWRLNGVRIDDPESWRLTFAEHNGF